MITLLFAGCATPPSTSQIHAVTAEIVEAIRTATGGRARVSIRPPSITGRLLQKSLAEDVSADVSTSREADAIGKALTQIARRHHLTMTEANSDAKMLRVDFHVGGNRTHSIRVAVAGIPNPIPGLASSRPRLAVIIDDMGSDEQSAKVLLKLPVHLTISVLPGLVFSEEVADDTAREGDEVMLHLPMIPESQTDHPETAELRPGMSEPQVRAAVLAMLQTVPHASGVNNHEGSKATADPVLMQALMPTLKEKGLFFIDSRTTASTVAFDTAQKFGVRSASRKVFLDDTLKWGSISRQLDLAVADAQRDGSAIAIGHPHSETIAVLKAELPRMREKGVQLVFASDLVH